METAAVLVGGTLLLISLGGGSKLSTEWAKLGESPVPQGDRAFAGAIGFVLVALAAILEKGGSTVLFWIALALGVVLALGYALFLWVTRNLNEGSAPEVPMVGPQGSARN